MSQEGGRPVLDSPDAPFPAGYRPSEPRPGSGRSRTQVPAETPGIFVLGWVAPGDLPNPGIEPESSALQVQFLSPEPPGNL